MRWNGKMSDPGHASQMAHRASVNALLRPSGILAPLAFAAPIHLRTTPPKALRERVIRIPDSDVAHNLRSSIYPASRFAPTHS